MVLWKKIVPSGSIDNMCSSYFLPSKISTPSWRRILLIRGRWSCKSLRPRGRFQYLEGTHEIFVHRYHPSRIIEFSTIVGGREQCHQFSAGKEFISILHHLMRPYDQIQILMFHKQSDDIRPKDKRYAPIIFCPALYRYISVFHRD